MSELPGFEGELPLQKSVQASKRPLDAMANQMEAVQPLITAAPEGGALLSEETSEIQEPMVETTIERFLERLNQGFGALKGLNLQGFRQIYPLFLILFGSVAAGIALSIVANFLGSINQFPLIGGVLRGLLELIGLVVLARFIADNLLKQQQRADLFARIVVLKKDLLG